VGVLQQELLWLLYDLGHLDRYPMALGNLGDLEEISGSTGRPASQELYDEAVEVARRDYGDQHVYPYTYLAGFHYRQRDFKAALRAWADAASVIKRYKYSKDDEEIYKEFMEINNELIPHILKADENLVSDPECFGHLVRFYDGLCSWEEESSTPVLHIGWVKPIVKCFTAFDYHVRAKLDIARVEDHDQEASSSRPAGGKASHLRTTSSSTAASATKTSKTLKKTSSARDGRVKVSVYSSEIGDIKPLLLCEKLNSSALHLHLTAQSQTEVKKSRNSSFEADFAVGTAGGRVKRQRRE